MNPCIPPEIISELLIFFLPYFQPKKIFPRPTKNISKKCCSFTCRRQGCTAGTQAEQQLSKAAKSPGDRPRRSYELQARRHWAAWGRSSPCQPPWPLWEPAVGSHGQHTPPAPQLPTSLGQLPSGPQLPIHHEAVGAQHPGCFPPPLRVCLEVSGPRSEAGKAGEDRRRRRSRWAAPGPGEGSHSPSSPPLLSEPALSTGSLYDPQSPASCTSTPSLLRAGGT